MGRVDASFESITGIAGNAEATGSVADGEGLEGGGFDEDVGGGIGNSGCGSAFDAGNGYGAVGIGDDEIGGGEFDF